jgi:ElaB/YqjD/DUF883 family membrane-anchored ribosome-binding protein
MDRKPGYKPPGGNGESKGKDAGRKPPLDLFGPKQPVHITADASAFELLSRGASEEDARVLRRLLIEWGQGDENTFPFQFSLLARAQWRAAASVPIEIAKVLQQHHNTAEDAARRIAQAAEAKLAEFELLGKLAPQLESYVMRLTAQGDEALKRLNEATGNFLQAEERAKRAARSNDWFILATAFVVIAALGIALGFLTCRYMTLRGWTH